MKNYQKFLEAINWYDNGKFVEEKEPEDRIIYILLYAKYYEIKDKLEFCREIYKKVLQLNKELKGANAMFLLRLEGGKKDDETITGTFMFKVMRNELKLANGEDEKIIKDYSYEKNIRNVANLESQTNIEKYVIKTKNKNEKN